MSVPAETFSFDQYHPNGVEMDADKALAIAEQANLALDSLNGGEEHSVIRDSITFDPRSLEEMGEGGPIALIRVGTSLLKLYEFDVKDGDETEKHYAIAHADFNNDPLIDNHANNLGLLFINGPVLLGSDSKVADKLGVGKGQRIAGTHFDIAVDKDELRITDHSSENRDLETKVGTYVFVKETKHTLGEATDIHRAKQIGKPILKKEV